MLSATLSTLVAVWHRTPRLEVAPNTRVIPRLLSSTHHPRRPVNRFVDRFVDRSIVGCVRGLAGCAIFANPTVGFADSPFASSVISYTAGSGAAAGFTNPMVVLGSPERFSGEGFLPQCVTPFQPAFRPNELVSLGLGGSLVVAFDHDVMDDPRNPYGIDLLVFGNAFFTDLGGGTGVVGGIAAEGGRISVSLDGKTWSVVPGLAADGLFPTLGYLDAAPYATAPGKVESDFLRPVDPSRTIGDLVGLDMESLVEFYAGSGGGVGVDIGALGLSRVRFVRVEGPLSVGFSPEVDAFADVAPLPPNADLDNSGAIDASDLALLLAAWGTAAPAYDPTYDLDGDGSIGAGDLALLLGAWGGGGA